MVRMTDYYLLRFTCFAEVLSRVLPNFFVVQALIEGILVLVDAFEQIKQLPDWLENRLYEPREPLERLGFTIFVVSTLKAVDTFQAKRSGGSTDLKWIYIKRGLSNSQ
ncbi:hypothetical protein ASG81_12150 [Paenibacillus sp. Soil522]|nr:hypothetical protein [Paenibacillus sp. Soil522]KRE46150.1 hypothetical protein ASG81_12150 [Paenibacillus sp. Soil522]